MTKVRYTPGLSAAAKRLLQNVEHTSRKIAGTQETRRQMRFDTNANRIRYGVPIFVIFTPDEAHNCLMLRLSRCRQNDPVFADGRDEVGKRVAQRREPPSDKISLMMFFFACQLQTCSSGYQTTTNASRSWHEMRWRQWMVFASHAV